MQTVAREIAIEMLPRYRIRRHCRDALTGRLQGQSARDDQNRSAVMDGIDDIVSCVIANRGCWVCRGMQPLFSDNLAFGRIKSSVYTAKGVGRAVEARAEICTSMPVFLEVLTDLWLSVL